MKIFSEENSKQHEDWKASIEFERFGKLISICNKMFKMQMFLVKHLNMLYLFRWFKLELEYYYESISDVGKKEMSMFRKLTQMLSLTKFTKNRMCLCIFHVQIQFCIRVKFMVRIWMSIFKSIFKNLRNEKITQNEIWFAKWIRHELKLCKTFLLCY